MSSGSDPGRKSGLPFFSKSDSASLPTLGFNWLARPFHFGVRSCRARVAATAPKTTGEQSLSSFNNVESRTTLIHLPFMMSQSTTSSNMRGSWRATSKVKRSSGSGSITLVRSAPPAAMTPMEDHCCQMNVSTTSLSSCLNLSSDSFMTDSIQDLPECGLKLGADGPSKQPGDSSLDLDFSWLQVHQVAQVPRSLLG